MQEDIGFEESGIPAYAWKELCKFILEPVLKQTFKKFENPTYVEKMLAKVNPQSPSGLTFARAKDYVELIKPCLFREAILSVQESVGEFGHRAPCEIRFNVDKEQQVRSDSEEGLVTFAIKQTKGTMEGRIRAYRINRADVRIREPVRWIDEPTAAEPISGEDAPDAYEVDDDDLPWNNELILINYQKESLRTAASEKFSVLGFAKTVKTTKEKTYVEVLAHKSCSPPPWINSGTIVVQRLCQFSSVVRQSWALSSLLMDIDSDLGRAFLGLPLYAYQYDPKDFGNKYSSILEKLNSKQKEVTQNLAWMATKDKDVRICALHGPPGTGKSQVVVALVQMLREIKPDIRILVAAPTNTAVDAVGRRIAYCLEPKEQNMQENTKPGAMQQSDYEEDRNLETIIHRFGHPIKIADNMQEYAFEDSMKKDERLQELGRKQVFLATLNGCGSTATRSAHEICRFDVVIVDEAGQALQPDTLIPTMILGIKKVILIGDPKQLPATVKDKLAQDAKYSLSWLQRISQHFPNKENIMPMLNVQYRMDQVICQFPSNEFYEGGLKTHESVVNRKGWKLVPFKFFNVQDSRERGDCSKFNNTEINLIEQVLLACVRHEADSKSYGIITGYAEQRQQLTARISIHSCLKGVKVSTVDGFQGQENKVIVLSTVRAGGSIGFLSDRQRVNVALTRAQNTLFVVGCASTLMSHGFWKRLIDLAKKNNNYVDISTYRLGNSKIMEEVILKEKPFVSSFTAVPGDWPALKK